MSPVAMKPTIASIEARAYPSIIRTDIQSSLLSQAQWCNMSQIRATDQPARFFTHVAGDGLHLVNDHWVIREDGSFQDGDTSEPCIIANAQRLCETFGLPPLHELWSECYPDDPMDQNDLACIVSSARPFMVLADPTIPDDQLSILADLRSIGCMDLAERIGGWLKRR